MPRGRATLAVSLLAAALLVAVPTRAETLPGPSLAELRVADYDGGWTADTVFRIRGRLVSGSAPIHAIQITLEGPGMEGRPKVTEVLPQDGELSAQVEIPHQPGAGRAAPGLYRVSVQARAPGSEGPVQALTLRIDNVRPGSAKPWLDAAWFRTDVAPVLRIAHPQGATPLSGFRGYAVSLRRDSAAPPCAGPERCTLAETDLPGGVGDDTFSLALLPEGVHVASVVAVSNTGVRSADAETVAVRVDGTRPDLTLHGAGGAWSSHPVRLVARATDPLSGMTAAGPAGPHTWIAVDGAQPTVVAGGEATAVVSGSGIHQVTAGARDAAGNARGEDAGSPPLSGVVRIDEEPPSIVFVRAGAPEDPELLEAVVADPRSGPAAAGGSIEVRPRGSDQAFEPLPTRTADGRLLARWDSDSYPHGSYEFRASGRDVAGNLAHSTRLANGAPLVLVSPLKSPSAVRFGFGGRQLVWHRCVRHGEGRRCRRQTIGPFGRRPHTRLVPYGRPVRVGGKATGPEGSPLAGVAIELVESFDPGAAATTRVTHLRTGPDGAFFARLAPGPSRRIEARFGGSRLLTRSSSRVLRLGVRSAVRLRASTIRAAIGGRPVVFSGRVPHAEARIPAYGRPVQLQFRLPGSPWTEFRTVQTDEHGRFRYPYSFSDDDSRGVRFWFRAYAPPQPGWPYEPAASRPLAVTGY